MRKILLTLLALLSLGGNGAWATDFTVSNPTQVTDLSTLDAGKFYILQSQGGSKYYNCYDNNTSQMSSKADYDYSCVVRLINTGESNYSIQQMSTKTYYQSLSDGTLVSLGASPVPYTISEQSSGIYFFDNNGLKLNTNNTGNLPQGANSTWTGAFSQWKIFEVDVQMNATLFNQEVGTFYDYYGTLQSGNMSWISGSNSGIEGFTISLTGNNVTLNKASNWALVVHSSTDETPYTMTLTAPVGYLITGYDLTARIWSQTSYPNTFTLTAENSTSKVIDSDTPNTLSVTGLDAQSTDISIVAASASSTTQRWLTMKSLVVKLKPATTPLVNVTYALYESDGSTFVSNTVVSQEENSAVSIPTEISSYTYYDYATEGTIGTSDCTIKVTRTLKSGYVISLDGLSNSKCYNIRNNRGTWAVGSGTTVVNSTYELGLAFSASDTKQQFAFITYEGNVYLYSVGEGKFAYIDGNKLSLTAAVTSAVEASPVTFVASTNATYKYSEPIIVTVNGNHFGVSTNYSPDIYKYQSQGDGGNCACIIEAGSFDATSALAALEEYFHPSYTVTYKVKDGSDNVLFTSNPVATTLGANITTLPAEYQLTNFYEYNTVDVTISASGNTDVVFTATPKAEPLVKYTADTSNPYYYNLNIRSQYLVYNSEATGQVTLQSTSEPFNANASWAFIGEPYAGFKVINKTKGTDYFLTYTSVVTGGNSGNNNIQFVEAGDFNNRYWIIDKNTGGFVLRMKENTNIYFHHDNTYKLLRTCSVTEWGSVHNDEGSTIVASTDEEVLFALYNSMKDYTFGTAIGQMNTTDASVVTNEQATSTIVGVGAAISASQTAAYADCYNALNTLAANIALVTPTAGFYRVKNVATDGYLYATAASGYTSTNRYVYANGSNSGTETIVQLVENNGHLYMLNQGHEFGWIAAQSSTGSGEVGYVKANGFDKYVNWLPGTAAGQIAFAICYGNGTGSYASYLTQGIYAVDTQDNAVVRGADYTENTAQWVFEPVSTLGITLNGPVDGKYYATLCVPFDITALDGATAYTLAKDGTTLNTTEISPIPAGTPVLLEGTTASATATIATAASTTISTSTALTGQYFASTFDGATNYTLGTDGTKLGFYHWDGTTLGANRAYVAGSTSGVKGFAINWGDADGINSVNNGQAMDNATIYNLAGQRMNKVHRGVNIVNGKKVIVK